jgi:hypothetical protein
MLIVLTVGNPDILPCHMTTLGLSKVKIVPGPGDVAPFKDVSIKAILYLLLHHPRRIVSGAVSATGTGLGKSAGKLGGCVKVLCPEAFTLVTTKLPSVAMKYSQM